MARRKHPVTTNDNMTKLNRIKPVTNVLFNLLFLLLALSCLLPVIFILIISITDEQVVRTQGYQFYVTAKTISASAYQYLWTQRATILRSLWVSVEVTVLGTIIGVMLTSLMGYVLSRREHKLNGFLTIMVFIPMIFGGGVAASYVMNTQVLNLTDTIWALICRWPCPASTSPSPGPSSAPQFPMRSSSQPRLTARPSGPFSSGSCCRFPSRCLPPSPCS